jgi:hypothetical protein
MKKLITISFLFLFLNCLSVFAGQVFVWTDEKGEVHYSKTEPQGWEQQKYDETAASRRNEQRRHEERQVQPEVIYQQPSGGGSETIIKYDSARRERCLQEMERQLICPPAGTTRMSPGRRSVAEADCAAVRAEFLRSCMGQ